MKFPDFPPPKSVHDNAIGRKITQEVVKSDSLPLQLVGKQLIYSLIPESSVQIARERGTRPNNEVMPSQLVPCLTCFSTYRVIRYKIFLLTFPR